MKKTIFIILLILLSSLVYAVKPTQEATGEETLEVRNPTVEIIQHNQEGVKLHTHLFNRSNGLIVNEIGADCFVHLYNNVGSHILKEEMNWDADATGSGGEFDLDIGSGNFSLIGSHSFIIQCNTTTQGGFSSGSFEVIGTGYQGGNNLPLIVAIGIVAVILFFFAFKLEEEHFILKLILIFSSVSLIYLIPAQFITGYAATTFYKLTLYIIGAFWLYVFVYIIYIVLKHFGLIVSGGDKDDKE